MYAIRKQKKTISIYQGLGENTVKSHLLRTKNSTLN